MAEPPPLARMIILYYTKEKSTWVSLFLGPKSMSAAQSRAQTGFARMVADKIFLIFLQCLRKQQTKRKKAPLFAVLQTACCH